MVAVSEANSYNLQRVFVVTKDDFVECKG